MRGRIPSLLALIALAGCSSKDRSASDTAAAVTATADSTGWMIAFPDRAPVKLHVLSVSGDSIVTESDRYQSVRRRGVQVVTRNTMRLQGDRLVGRTVAHYKTTGPDSVLQLRTEGTRRP